MSSGDIRRLIDMIKDQDGEGSGLDADMLRGLIPSSSSQPNVIPVTDSSGKIPNEFIDSESLGGGSSGAVTAPTISGPSQVKYDTEFTLTASGSLTAFADNGATIDHYEWLLPDDTTVTGNSITYTAPDSSHIGETLVFKCKAIDTLGNESKYSKHDVTVSDNSIPIIDNIDWNSNDFYENHTYTVTIIAHDLDSEPLQYKVTCNDPNVTITPNDWDNNNSFNVSFPDYTEDTTVTFTYHVKDSTDEVTQDEDKIVHDGLPIGDTGVFGGGSSNSNRYNTIDYITISTLGNAQDFGDLTVSRYLLATTSNETNDRGVFGGGCSNNYLNTIDYITISTLGNANDYGDLTVTRGTLAATSNGTNDRGVFGGGYNGSNYFSTIDYITISTLGNVQNFGDLTVTRGALAATSNGTNDRGVFGGGYNNSYFNIIDYITISSLGNAHDFGDLIVNRRYLSATSNGTNDRGVFGGGYNSGTYYNTIDYITISSLGNAHDFGDLIVIRGYLAATSNGTNNRGVFGGGYDNSNYFSTIDYITISTLGNAHDFGDLTVSRWGLAATSNA